MSLKSGRIDALTPIVNSLEHPQIFYITEPKELEVKSGFILNFMTITHGPETWKKITDKNNMSTYIISHRPIESSEYVDHIVKLEKKSGFIRILA